MVYYVRNKVNMGVIGNAAGANAGFYDQIRIYCMWKAVRHVLTAFHCLWSTISCVLTHFMVFFMSHEYDTNPESVSPFLFQFSLFYSWQKRDKNMKNM